MLQPKIQKAIDAALAASGQKPNKALPDDVLSAIDNAIGGGETPSQTELDITPVVPSSDVSAIAPEIKEAVISKHSESFKNVMSPREIDGGYVFDGITHSENGPGTPFTFSDPEFIDAIPEEAYVGEYGTLRVKRARDLMGSGKSFDSRRGEFGEISSLKGDGVMNRILSGTDLASIQEHDFDLLKFFAANRGDKQLQQSAELYFTGEPTRQLGGDGSRKNKFRQENRIAMVSRLSAISPQFAALNKAESDMMKAESFPTDYPVFMHNDYERNLVESENVPDNVKGMIGLYVTNRLNRLKKNLPVLDETNVEEYMQATSASEGYKDSMNKAYTLYPEMEEKAGERNQGGLRALSDVMEGVKPEDVNKIYFSMLMDEYNSLAGKVLPNWNRPVSEDSGVVTDIVDAIGSMPMMLGFTSNEEKRFFEIEAQLRALTPLVLYNRTPRESVKDQDVSFGEAAARGFERSIAGEFAESRNPSPSESQAVFERSLNAIGTLDEASKGRITMSRNALEKDSSISSAEAWGNITGVAGGIAATLAATRGSAIGRVATSKLAKAPVVGRALAGATTKAGKIRQASTSGAISGGISYEIGGKLNKNLADELDFGSGLLGGGAGELVKGAFGRYVREAAPSIIDKIKTALIGRAGSGLGELAEETIQTVYQETAKQGSFKDAYNQLRKDGGPLSGLSEAGFFVLSSFMMGAVMGGAGDAAIDSDTAQAMSQYSKDLPVSDQEILNAFVKRAIVSESSVGNEQAAPPSEAGLEAPVDTQSPEAPVLAEESVGDPGIDGNGQTLDPSSEPEVIEDADVDSSESLDFEAIESLIDKSDRVLERNGYTWTYAVDGDSVVGVKRAKGGASVTYVIDANSDVRKLVNGKPKGKSLKPGGMFHSAVTKWPYESGVVQTEDQKMAKSVDIIADNPSKPAEINTESIPSDFMPEAPSIERYVMHKGGSEGGEFDAKVARQLVPGMLDIASTISDPVLKNKVRDLAYDISDTIDTISNNKSLEVEEVSPEVLTENGTVDTIGEASIQAPSIDESPHVKAKQIAESYGMQDLYAVMEDALENGIIPESTNGFRSARFQSATSRKSPLSEMYQEFRRRLPELRRSSPRSTGPDRAKSYISINEKVSEGGASIDANVESITSNHKESIDAASASLNVTIQDALINGDVTASSRKELESIYNEVIQRAGLSEVLSEIEAMVSSGVDGHGSIFNTTDADLVSRISKRALIGQSILGEDSMIEEPARSIAANLDQNAKMFDPMNEVSFSMNTIAPGSPVGMAGGVVAPGSALLTVEPITGEVPKLNRTVLAEAAKSLGIVVRRKSSKGKGKFKKSFGWYNAKSGGVVLSSLEDLVTLSHEIGHALDGRHKMSETILSMDGRQSMQHEIDRLASIQPPPPKDHPKPEIYTIQEAIAELIRHLVIAPSGTSSSFPLMTSTINSFLSEKESKGLSSFSEDIRKLYGATAKDRASAVMEKAGFDERVVEDMDKRSAFSSIFDRLNIAWVDAMYPVWKTIRMSVTADAMKGIIPSRRPKVLLSRFLGYSSVFEEMLDSGIELAPGDVLIDQDVPDSWVDSQHSAMMESGKEIDRSKLKNRTVNLQYLLEVGPASSLDSIKLWLNDLNKYMVAQRTISVVDSGRMKSDAVISGIGSGVQSDYDAANAIMEEFEDMGNKPGGKEYLDRIVEGARRYRVYSGGLMQYLVNAGRITPEQYADIVNNNDNYVAMNRIMEDGPDDLDPNELSSPVSLAGIRKPVNRFLGSKRAIRDPYTSLIKNTYLIYKEGIRNDFMEAFTSMSTSEGAVIEGDQALIRDVTRFVTKEDASKKPVFSSTMADNKPANKTEIIKVFKEGIPHYFEVDEKLYDSLSNMYSAGPIGGKMKMLTIYARVIRFTVTHALPFAVRNLIRDTFNRLGGISSVDFGNQGLMSIISDFKKNETNSQKSKTFRDAYKDFNRFGGGQAGYYYSNHVDYYLELDDQLRKATGDRSRLRSLIVKPQNLATKTGRKEIAFAASSHPLWKRYKAILTDSENINRVQEYRNTIKQTQHLVDDGTWSPYDQELYAAHSGRKLLDFAVGGKTAKLISMIIPFFNAGIQGTARTISAMRDNPSAFMVRWAAMVLAPTLAMRALRDDEDDEELRMAAPYRRDLFWNIKAGDGWISLPRPFEIGVLASGVERSIDALMDKEYAMEGYWGTLGQTIFPFSRKNLLNNTNPVMAELLSNYDSRLKRSIVSDRDKNAARSLRSNSRSSRLGSAVEDLSWMTLNEVKGKVYADKGFIDARQADYFIGQTFTYFGRMAMRISNIGRTRSETSTILNDWSVTGLYRHPVTEEAAPMQKLREYTNLYKLNRDPVYVGVMDIRALYYDALSRGDTNADMYRSEWLDAASEAIQYYESNKIGQDKKSKTKKTKKR